MILVINILIERAEKLLYPPMRRPKNFEATNETPSFAKSTNETLSFAKLTNEKAECVHSFDKLAVLHFSEILPGRGICKLNKLDKNGKKGRYQRRRLR